MTAYTYDTDYGYIHWSTTCKDDWSNIVEKSRSGYTLKLQQPAMHSYRACEEKLGYEIKLTGTWRSCALQSQLYNSDKTRYAHPDKTLHTQGLAIDVSTNYGTYKTWRIKRALLNHGWKQSRPDDEPWHFSYYLKA
jgi:hypothetical protein